MPFNWEHFYENVQQDFKLLLFLVGAICLFRIGFILVMHHYLSELTVFLDIFTACYYGLRISLKSAGLLALLSFFLCLSWQLAVKRRPSRLRLLLGTFYVSLLSLLFYARIPYYEQFHMGFNQLVFNTFQEDGYALFYTLREQYDLLPRLVLAGLTAWLLRKALQGWLSCRIIPLPRFSRWYQNIAVRAAFLLLVYHLTVFIRFGGSMTYADNIDWENSGITGDQLLNEAVLDDLQALYRAYELHERMLNSTGLAVDPARMAGYGRHLSGKQITTEDLDEYLKKSAGGAIVKQPAHIFLIIAESYANWPLLPQYADLNIANGLKAIIARQDAAYVRAMLPNGMSTISGVLGITTGFTDANLYLNCIPEGYREQFPTAIAPQLKRLGYLPRFWYAGPSSWERVKDFVLAQGFEEFYGRGDYPSAAGNVWGSDDKYLFNAVLAGTNDQPSTFNVILTVSNHAPYTVDLAAEGFEPEKIRAGLPDSLKTDQEFIKQLGHFWYADQMLAQFVARARSRYPDSLFLIVGDHADRLNIENNPGLYERYGIPLVVYGPGIDKTVFSEITAGSHINIAPTLIELVAPAGFSYYSVGASLTGGNPVGVNYGFWITGDYIGKDQNGPVEPIRGAGTAGPAPDWAQIEQEIDCLRSISWWRMKNGGTLNSR